SGSGCVRWWARPCAPWSCSCLRIDGRPGRCWGGGGDAADGDDLGCPDGEALEDDTVVAVVGVHDQPGAGIDPDVAGVGGAAAGAGDEQQVTRGELVEPYDRGAIVDLGTGG